MNGPIKKTNLIIISGLPATGKTSIGKELSSKLQLPYFYKDLFKEAMYDYIEIPKSLEMNKKMGALAFANLEAVSAQLLENSISHIIEAPFENKWFTPVLKSLKTKFKFNIIQIQLECDGEILKNRFLNRFEGKEIHEGHQSDKYFHLLEEKLLLGKMDHLDIESSKIILDTTDFKTIDLENIIKEVRELI